MANEGIRETAGICAAATSMLTELRTFTSHVCAVKRKSFAKSLLCPWPEELQKHHLHLWLRCWTQRGDVASVGRDSAETW